MRKNSPVSPQEYEFPSDPSWVSVTDLKGRSTCCNQAFVEVSGYTSSELLAARGMSLVQLLD